MWCDNIKQQAAINFFTHPNTHLGGFWSDWYIPPRPDMSKYTSFISLEGIKWIGPPQRQNVRPWLSFGNFFQAGESRKDRAWLDEISANAGGCSRVHNFSEILGYLLRICGLEIGNNFSSNYLLWKVAFSALIYSSWDDMWMDMVGKGVWLEPINASLWRQVVRSSLVYNTSGSFCDFLHSHIWWL